ncbi:hypothetical protein CAP35_04705 [Chitinophagaceae bacterium IBVUCB1]|nr:hypothetical protein CAP35_04705 [Chitinophagaceae bacterium IBVUCB1]
MNLGQNYPHYKFGRSFFSLPIISKINDEKITNLIIHVDSQSTKFFSKKVLDAIILWNRDFVNTLNEKSNLKEIQCKNIDAFILKVAKTPKVKAGDYGGCWLDCDYVNEKYLFELDKFTYFEHVAINKIA